MLKLLSLHHQGKRSGLNLLPAKHQRKSRCLNYCQRSNRAIWKLAVELKLLPATHQRSAGCLNYCQRSTRSIWNSHTQPAAIQVGGALCFTHLSEPFTAKHTFREIHLMRLSRPCDRNKADACFSHRIFHAVGLPAWSANIVQRLRQF